MTGARVIGLCRRSKYGLIHSDRGFSMVCHLGMSGRWRIDPAAPDKHDHLLLETAAHSFALCDPRRFGSVDLVETAALEAWPQFAVLRPEPLGDSFTADHFRGAHKGRAQPIQTCILDPRIYKGLGNDYTPANRVVGK